MLLLGWDAADWKVIRPLLAAGLMPNLAGLMARGVHGNHATLYPDLSPMLWTSIATGKRPSKHGILGFSEPTADGTAVRPCSVLSRTSKALWNILNQNGKRSIVVGWWPSFPAEPIDGVMVSNHFQKVPDDPDTPPPSLPRGMVHPPELADELGELRVRPCELSLELLRLFVPKAEQVNQETDKSLHDLAKVIAENLSIHSVATDLLESEEWDFAAVYFDAIDHACHRFMRFYPPRQEWVSKEEFDLYKDVVSNVYQWHDAMLGRYLELVGPEAHVIIVSDHGFHSDEQRPGWIPCEPAGPAAEHRYFGMVVMAGPGLRQGERIHGTSVLDIAPTVLTLFGLPVGLDMDGNAQVQAWQDPPVVERISSWETVDGPSGCHPPGSTQDPRAIAAQLEQLVALGYVSPLPDDRSEAVRETVRELDYNLSRALADGGRPYESIPILETLWREWPKEHRFGLHLLDYYGRCGRIAQRRAALEQLTEQAGRYANEAAQALESLPSPSVQADAHGHDPAVRRQQFERRGLIELRAGLDLTGAWIQQALLEQDRATATDLLKPLLERRDDPSSLPFPQASLAASILVQLGRLEEALPVVERLLAIEPEHQNLSTLRAEIQFRRRDWSQAAECAAQSLALVYFNPRLHLILGLSLARLGRRSDATAELRVALQQNPSLLLAYRALEKLHADRPVEAFQYRSQATILAERIRAIRRRLACDDWSHSDLSAGPTTSTASLELQYAGLCEHEPAAAAARSPEELVVVSGLPRSGTSMLMRVLQFGGISLLSDGMRLADASNPLGYYEFEPVRQLLLRQGPNDLAWLDQGRGRAVKVVTPLLRHLPAQLPARLVVMHRPLDSVLRSQEAMKQRLATEQVAVLAASQPQVRSKSVGVTAAALELQYNTELQLLLNLIDHRPNWQVLHVSYEQMIHDPAGQCSRLALFLGEAFRPCDAVAGVDPSLRRF
ncbi:alkaline phosphatase family protein [Synechococcus sp. CBW1004]|nr:alkaline phosphatase family protein [Synechococcus sp. CBW1004]